MNTRLARNSWYRMRQRCENPQNNRYYIYGAVGITVCQRWLSFEKFFADMGQRPSVDHSIERIDGTKGYYPENCRWATRVEQARNRSSNHLVEIDGEVKCVTEWAEKHALSPWTIFKRLRKGQSGAMLLRPPERQMENGEYFTCRKSLHAFPEWRRFDGRRQAFCLLCKRTRDARKRERKRQLESERR